MKIVDQNEICDIASQMYNFYKSKDLVEHFKRIGPKM